MIPHGNPRGPGEKHHKLFGTHLETVSTHVSVYDTGQDAVALAMILQPSLSKEKSLVPLPPNKIKLEPQKIFDP